MAETMERRQITDASHFGRRLGRLLLLFLICQALVGAQGVTPENPFQQFDAARRLLADGEEEQAAAAFKSFLTVVVRRLAIRSSERGNFEHGSHLFEEALSLAPNDVGLRMDYTRAAFNATDFVQARQLAEETVRQEPENPETHLLLGQVLYQLREYQGARAQLETANEKSPEFATAYVLGKTYLLMHDEKAARTLFDSMLRQWGDTEVTHIFIGRAYSVTSHPGEAEAEFHKAIEINPRAQGAHYQMGLAYVRDDEASGYEKAIPEFRAELALSPDDFSSHYMLGYLLSTRQRKWEEGEKELARAIALRPQDVQALLALAETYNATGRPQDAEATLRKIVSSAAIASASGSPDQDVARAHYLLGRLLLAQPGHTDEAKRELAQVAEAQRHSGTVLTADARAAGAGSVLRQEPVIEMQPPTKVEDSPEKDRASAQQLDSIIAEAYNNLGAITGDGHDFASAAAYFGRARQWNPALPGLDRNQGMALFYIGQYREAVPLFRKYLESSPADMAARGALAFSLFNLEDFGGVVETLRPAKDQIQTPKLAFVYAASLARTGAPEGMERLKSLESANPDSAEIHRELALAYQQVGQTKDADREMELCERLKKQNKETK